MLVHKTFFYRAKTLFVSGTPAFGCIDFTESAARVITWFQVDYGSRGANFHLFFCVLHSAKLARMRDTASNARVATQALNALALGNACIFEVLVHRVAPSVGQKEGRRVVGQKRRAVGQKERVRGQKRRFVGLKK